MITSRRFGLLGLINLLLSIQPFVNGQATTTTATHSDTSGDIPLYQKRFPWPNLPYQADTGNGPRGIQTGYNICNSTTQNQNSLCQTSFLNSIQEFCLWGAPQPNSIVADIEGEMVAYCTTKKFGTRLIPAGAIQGIQLTRTPGYIQVVGYIDQTGLGLQASDTGGEEDPHGADQRGNPLGALMYSSAFNAAGANSSGYTQVIEWSYFIGSGVFCYKACDPAGANAAKLCEHIYDRIGCTYNAPADYASIKGTYQACKGEDQLPAGTYVENGVTKTYTQPPESAGPITSIPYTPAIPAVSDCVSYPDTNALWPDLPKVNLNSTMSNNSTNSTSFTNTTASGRTSSATKASGNAAGSAASSASSSMMFSSFMCLVVALMVVCVTN